MHAIGGRIAAALARWRSGESPQPVAIISIPKAGTHLLTTLLHETGAAVNSWRHFAPSDVAADGDGPDPVRLGSRVAKLRAGQFLTLHHPHDGLLVRVFSDMGIRTIFIHRDPRAVALSHAHYVRGLPPHRLHQRWLAMDLPEAVLTSMNGVEPNRSDGGLAALADRYDAYAGWLHDADLSVRFEDLADDGPQRRACPEQMADLLELTPGDRDVFVVGAERWIGYRNSPTMRSGTADGWRSELPDDLATQLTDAFGAGRLASWSTDRQAPVEDE